MNNSIPPAGDGAPPQEPLPTSPLEPSETRSSVRTEAESANARLGMVMFLCYLAFYAGFVLLSAFAPQTMGRTLSAFGGINLAIAYGMALILAALLLAAIYMFLCRRPATEITR